MEDTKVISWWKKFMMNLKNFAAGKQVQKLEKRLLVRNSKSKDSSVIMGSERHKHGGQNYLLYN